MEEDDDAGSTGAGEDVPFQGMGPSDKTVSGLKHMEYQNNGYRKTQ